MTKPQPFCCKASGCSSLPFPSPLTPHPLPPQQHDLILAWGTVGYLSSSATTSRGLDSWDQQMLVVMEEILLGRSNFQGTVTKVVTFYLGKTDILHSERRGEQTCTTRMCGQEGSSAQLLSHKSCWPRWHRPGKQRRPCNHVLQQGAPKLHKYNQLHTLCSCSVWKAVLNKRDTSLLFLFYHYCKMHHKSLKSRGAQGSQHTPTSMHAALIMILASLAWTFGSTDTLTLRQQISLHYS